MPLTDIIVRRTKPTSKPLKLSDGGGMYLLINPTGSRLWRFDYRYNSKRKTQAFGIYPDVSLKLAREGREQARELLARGIDPGAKRRAEKSNDTNTFEAVAREWFAKFEPQWAKSHADKIICRLELDVFPWLGNHPIAKITAPELLTVLRRIENRGALDTTHRAHQNCGQIFRYGVATGRCERDPSGDLHGALAPAKHTHFAAITDPAAVGELIRAIEAFRGMFVVQCALKLAPLFFVRPGELRNAQWQQFDLEKAE